MLYHYMYAYIHVLVHTMVCPPHAPQGEGGDTHGMGIHHVVYTLIPPLGVLHPGVYPGSIPPDPRNPRIGGPQMTYLMYLNGHIMDHNVGHY